MCERALLSEDRCDPQMIIRNTAIVNDKIFELIGESSIYINFKTRISEIFLKWSQYNTNLIQQAAMNLLWLFSSTGQLMFISIVNEEIYFLFNSSV